MNSRSSYWASLKLTQHVLAYIAIIGFFAMTGYILSHGVGNLDAEESFIVGNLTGMAAAIAKDIYGYYFGGSKAEHDATRLPFSNFKRKNNSNIKIDSK